MSLSASDIENIVTALAPKITEQVSKEHRDFYIDGETHYNDHRAWAKFKKEIASEEVYDLKNILVMYRLTKSLWFKAFLGAAAMGSIVLVVASLGFHKG